jgi:hypothetical protein
MLWIYHVYTLICMLQFPVWWFLVATFRYHAYTSLLTPRPDLYIMSDNNNNNSTTMVVYERTSRGLLDIELSLACALATVFAVLYLMLQRISEELDGGRCLDQNDTGPPSSASDDALTLLSGGEEANLRNVLHAVRPTFWAWVLLHGLVLSALGVGPERATTREGLWLKALLRFGGLYGLCRTASWERRQLAQAGAAVLYLAWVYAYATSRPRVPHYPQLLLFDPLLVVGHMGDAEPHMRLVLRCRLCMVALSGAGLVMLLGRL